jgi:hypothetical protein
LLNDKQTFSLQQQFVPKVRIFYEFFFLKDVLISHQFQNDLMATISKFKLCNDTRNSMLFVNESTLQLIGGRNKLMVDGYGELLEDLNGPIRLKLQISALNKQTGQWNHANPIIFPDMCLAFGHFFFDYLTVSTPPIKKCPVAKVRQWLIFFCRVYQYIFFEREFIGSTTLRLI